jgi:hypothetical protein
MKLKVLTSASDSSQAQQPVRWAVKNCVLAFCTAVGGLWIVLAAAAGAAAQDQPGTGPGDALLRLVPADATVVLRVDGLRDQRRSFTASRLYSGLQQLPSVKAWLESEKGQQLRRSRDQIEAALGVKLSEICDELLGDSVVLALRLPPDAPADSSQARGLLLFQARDKTLLERLIQVVNTKQKAGGELAQVTECEHGGATYRMREFPRASARASEWYITYPDGTFAFSNSESLIKSVIDRKRRGESRNPADASGTRDVALSPIDRGLTDLDRFQSVKRRMPAGSLARLFVEPRQIERLIAASPAPSKAADARILAMLRRYLGAVEYAAASLAWSDAGVVVQTVETLDRSKLDPWLLRWAGNTRRPDAAISRVPSTTLAIASLHLDAPALYEALSQIVPDEDQPKLRNLEAVLSGLLLGQDVRTRILPQLGPSVIAYVESTPEGLDEDRNSTTPASAMTPAFAQVLVVDLQKGERPGEEPVPTPGAVTTAAAIENALRTVLSFAALDEKRNNGRSRITTRLVAGANVTTLDFPIPFAYALDAGGSRLVVGSSSEAVARYLESASKPEAGDRFRQLQAKSFPDDGTFLCVDLSALGKLAGRRRDRLVEILATRKNRPAADVDRDLSQVLAFARLFEAGYVTSRFEAEAAAVHRRVGLILPDSKFTSSRTP